jgi:hypothetical protein
MCEMAAQPTIRCMNATVLNYHLANARAADIEREMQHMLIREPKRRRGFAAPRHRRRRTALKARLIG